MYSYASLLGIARANGYIPYLPLFHPLTYTFRLSHIRDTEASCPLTVTDPLPCGYVQNFNHLPAANISIDGYIQSWKYFQFVQDEIRKEFSFSQQNQAHITSKYLSYVSKYLKEGRVVISVHVRRGDKLSKGFQGLGFKPAPLEYLKNAMDLMALKYPFGVFLVVSDEIEWCKQNLRHIYIEYFFKNNKNEERRIENVRLITNFNQTPVNVNDNANDKSVTREAIPIVFTSSYSSPLIDLGILSMANHSIITVGTFGWWGAWLANGTVIYYKNHIISGSVLDSQTINEDFFPPQWIPLSIASHDHVNYLLYFLHILVVFCFNIYTYLL